MSIDKRKKDFNWVVANDQGMTLSWDEVQIAVLMDLRDELKRLNSIMHCSNALDIPNILRGIRKNTNITKIERKEKLCHRPKNRLSYYRTLRRNRIRI